MRLGRLSGDLRGRQEELGAHAAPRGPSSGGLREPRVAGGRLRVLTEATEFVALAFKHLEAV